MPRPNALHLYQANFLYLVSMLLVVIVGTAAQAWSIGWGLLVTELILILLPSLIFLRAARLPLVPALRLRPLKPLAVLLSLLIGVGLWFFASWLDVLAAYLLGYQPQSTSSQLPQTVAQSLLIFAGFALAAPVCEELLFRGAIQPAYEKISPRLAILSVGLLFALFHLRFQGLVGLLPISLALGYLAWRTGSVYSSILAHFGNNAMAVGIMVLTGMRPDLIASLAYFISLPTALLGLLVGLVGLRLVRRLYPQPEREVQDLTAQAGAAPRTTAILVLLPVLAALSIYSYFASQEYLLGRFPERVATEPVQLRAAPWTEPVSLHYQIRDKLGQPAGEVRCQITPGGAGLPSLVLLECQVEQAAYQVDIGNSHYISGGFAYRQSALWDSATMSLVESSSFMDTPHGYEESVAISRHPDDPTAALDMLVTVRQTLNEPVRDQGTQLAPTVLLKGEWPWRLSALAFKTGDLRQAQLAIPQVWKDDLQQFTPEVIDRVVQVLGVEPISVPAGDFRAWKVGFNGETTWYAVDPPYSLLMYDTGQVTYVLVESE